MSRASKLPALDEGNANHDTPRVDAMEVTIECLAGSLNDLPKVRIR